MQVISGVSLAAYWLSNIISDIVKTYVPIIIIIILTFVFQLHYDGVWELLMIYPIAIVPFTYITSFMFTNEGKVMQMWSKEERHPMWQVIHL